MKKWELVYLFMDCIKHNYILGGISYGKESIR